MRFRMLSWIACWILGTILGSEYSENWRDNLWSLLGFILLGGGVGYIGGFLDCKYPSRRISKNESS